MQRSPAMQRFYDMVMEMTRNEIGDEAAEVLAVGSEHKYNCRCATCLRWWVQMGPEWTGEKWSFGPFTEEEFVKAGGKIPEGNPEDEEPPFELHDDETEIDSI